MEVAPLPIITPKNSIKESFMINQGSKTFKIIIEIQNSNIIILNLSEENELYEEYELNLTFDDLKQIHKVFLMLNSSQDFIEYIKALIENNKITIIKEDENKISIKMIVEYLLKQNTIQLDLKLKKMNLDIVVKDMLKQIIDLNNRLKKVESDYTELKEENKSLKEENKIVKENNIKMLKYIESIKKEIVELKNTDENKLKFSSNKSNMKINSSIMKEGEFGNIKSTIEEKMNLKIKEIKKIFQATVDGGEPNDFFNKCCGIKNTLVLYESAGKRRFGGFASESWGNIYNEKSDKNCFLFSLDKNKIFTIKDNNYFQIASGNNNGPSFIHEGAYCIELKGNSFSNNSLTTCENIHPNIFNGENNILSEDGHYRRISCRDYEIFQIIF